MKKTISNEEIREILVKRVDQQKQAVGIVVGLIDPNGRRVVAHGKVANGDPRAVDGNTIFEIGSITKVFTSLALADMVMRNEVALDDPAAKYLPENVDMPERNGKRITLLDLATHSSGLPSVPGNLKFEHDYSVEDLHQFLSGYTLSRDPGSEYEYSNLGAGLLGHLLARRAEMDYESLIQSRIARPLGMPDTRITPSPSMKERMATGHNAMLAPVANSGLPTPLAGAGAIRSSANDILTILEAFLGCKESPLAPSMKTMLEVRRPAGQATIGLGWLVMPVHGQEIVGHNGATAGFRSFAAYNPQERSGVVVLSNASTATGMDDVGFHVLNPRVPLAQPAAPKQHTEIRIDPTLLVYYTGRYQVTPTLILEITCNGDRLFAQGFAQAGTQPISLPKFELFAEGQERFFARVADTEIVFETGAGGRAISLVLHKAGRAMPAPRL